MKEKQVSKTDAEDKIRYYYADIVVGVKEQSILEDQRELDVGYDFLYEKLRHLEQRVTALEENKKPSKESKEEK